MAETISARLRSVGLEYIRQRGREGSRSAQRPVRVKLTRADAFAAATCPPDGETENWWRRLNEALGTMSSDFVNASLWGHQYVRVEHVHVNSGGQAVIGNVKNKARATKA